jgi:hypothetical protein
MDGGNEQRVAITFCSKAGLSATETLVLVQKAYGNEALNRLNVFRWYSRFRDGRELVKDDERGGCLKSTCCYCCWFSQKWRSNRIKNESRILHPQDSIFRLMLVLFFGFWKRVWEREIGVHVLFHTPWHLSKGKIESHLARHYRDGRCRQKSLKQNYYGRWELMFRPRLRNKATQFWIGWWDIPSAEETEIPKVPRQEHVDNFFDSQGVVHKEFVTEGKQ